jgi:hypothetical protein
MLRIAILLLACGAFAAGCTGDSEKSPAPPPEPMAVTGSDQVVIYVPTMVCETCPGKVAEGLALLPWVDAESIQPDRKKRQVRFRVKDRAAFDADALKDSISRKGFKDVQVLINPT